MLVDMNAIYRRTVLPISELMSTVLDMRKGHHRLCDGLRGVETAWLGFNCAA